MIGIPSLSNQQSASSGSSSGGIVAISGGAGGNDLRTMLEWSRGTPQNGGVPMDLQSGTFARLGNNAISAGTNLGGASASFSLPYLPIILIGGAYLLWMRSRR